MQWGFEGRIAKPTDWRLPLSRQWEYKEESRKNHQPSSEEMEVLLRLYKLQEKKSNMQTRPTEIQRNKRNKITLTNIAQYT